MIAIHTCGKCNTYIGATDKDDAENYLCPVCEQDNVNKITFETKL
jgi:hypothetical protein